MVNTLENSDDEEKTEEKSDSKALIDIKISDVLGLSKSAIEVRKATENIIKAFEKGIGKISNPIITILQAKADAKALTVRGEAEIQLVEKKLGLFLKSTNLLRDAGISEEFTELSLRYLERQILEGVTKQDVREKVAGLLFEEIPLVPRQKLSPANIDEDWLTLFWTSVENKSTEDIQRIYARILAGECLSPGSFSARLLHILSIMTPKDARAFEMICSMSIQDEGGTYLLEPLGTVAVWSLLLEFRWL